MKYSRALEFIGEVRGGISWQSFAAGAVSNFDALLELWMGTEAALRFLTGGEISREYIERQVPVIFRRLHCNEERNPYLTLGLPSGATAKEIKKRWKELMLIYHPDRNKGKDAVECAKRINEAYTVLKDPVRRMRYDWSRAEVAQGRKGESADGFRVRTRGKPSMKDGVRAMAVRFIIPASVAVSALLIVVILRDNMPLEGGGTEQQSGRAAEQRSGTAVVQGIRAAGIGADRRADRPAGRQAQRLSGSAEQPRSRPVEQQARTEKQNRQKEQNDRPASQQTDWLEGLQGQRLSGSAEQQIMTEQQNSQEEQRQASRQADRLSIMQTGQQAGGPSVLQADGPSERDLWGELSLFLGGYIRAYEEGDAEGFTSHYSSSAIENNRMDIRAIRKAYKEHLQGRRFRYTLKGIDFHPQGENIFVSASYAIDRLDAESREYPLKGRIRWVLSREKEGLKIVRIDYDRN